MRDLSLEEINMVITSIDAAMEDEGVDKEKLGKVLELFEMEQVLLSKPRGRRPAVSKGRKE